MSTWDEFDTVFRVTTAGRQGIIAPSTYMMSASASAGGHPASYGADGDYLTFWDSNKTLPVSLRFDLGSTRRVQYIGVNQRKDSVAYARSGTEQSARIRDYRVFVSDSTRFQRLRVDEAWIGSEYAGGGGPAPTIFEAEGGSCQGTIDWPQDRESDAEASEFDARASAGASNSVAGMSNSRAGASNSRDRGVRSGASSGKAPGSEW